MLNPGLAWACGGAVTLRARAMPPALLVPLPSILGMTLETGGEAGHQDLDVSQATGQAF